ncbi:MAG TPA: hypothetical protein VFQ05_06645 [Candidatus Eisenbacteria bacterium]|nr:hypothetical protein [Candidatus Eisenbacteria bacterium]
MTSHVEQQIAARIAQARARVQRAYDEDIQPLARHGGNRRPDGSQGNQITLTKQRGGSRDYVIARLERDDPPLAQRVKRGEVTATAAARQKGSAPQLGARHPGESGPFGEYGAGEDDEPDDDGQDDEQHDHTEERTNP